MPNIIDKTKWYNIEEISQIGKDGTFPSKSKIHIKKMLQSGKLVGVNIGVHTTEEWRVKGESLLNFMEGEKNYEKEN